MLKELKSISKHTIIYGFGNILSRAIGFLMLPFYTHFIEPAEYGVMALVDLAGYIIGIFVTMEVSTAFLKYYYDCKSEEEKKQLIGTTQLLVLFNGLLILGILEIYASEICKLIVGDIKYTLLFQLLFVSLFFQALNNVFLSYLRAREMSKSFTIVQVLQIFFALSLNIYFVAFLKKGIMGIFLSNTISIGLFVLVCNSWLIYKSGVNMSGYFLKRLTVFGLPLIPATISEMVLHYSDRYFLKMYSTMEMVGIYSVAYKFGMIVGLVINNPFRLAWSAKLFDLSKNESGKDIQQKVLTYLLFTMFFIALAISLPIKEIIYLITPKEYHEAHRIVPIVVLGYVFFGVNWVFRGGLLIYKKTGLVCLVALITAVLNIFLNWILIKGYGAMGAAWATMLSFLIFSTLMYIVSSKYYPVAYEMSRVVKIVIVAALIFTASRLIPEMPLIFSLIIKGLLILCYPILLYFFDFYNDKEKKIIFKTFRVLYEVR